ncbi:MAG: ATP phosphoribosyltransferase regulatory subunit, partial [Gemmatimonadetes bacterium]|nr:ATP phosphoribosyltransferase regulatory subunit [Gemmatimonadota bacterium]
MSAKHEWLNLLEVSGPFLAVPVLREVFPQGLEELDASHAKRLRSAYEEWRDAVDGDDADRDKLHAAWIDEVLRTALEADDQLLKAGEDVPASIVELPEHDTAIAPELVFVNPTHGAAVLAPVHVFPPDTDLSASMKFGGLSCSPGDRMALHLRALNVPFGIVTNGERWMLVHAPTGQVATFASWYARIWGQEPATLRAFVSLLGVRRFFAPAQDRLPALFERSLKHQDEVTDALGDQVRRAIEVLVQALDRADQDRNRELLRDVKPQELYEAGLTVMMRLVFLLAAEERGLLLLGEPRYDSFYAVSTLRMQLRGESDEILERRRASWSRLLAVFRAVFGGIDHPTLRLPAMGGSLFDPDRFPFLEGRLKGTSWRQHRAEPLPIDDRTVLLLLEAIQTFEGRTLSYRALDVEQIGHVYEGLLERTVSRVEDVTLELEAGASAKDARVTLGELESARLDGKAAVTSLLAERSERSESAIRNTLAAEVEPQQRARLLSACRGDVKLRDRLAPYVRLMRTDPWGYPLVHPKGAFVVVLGADRRETGTHYTPKSLTERIVEETLTPLVYDGPAKGAPRAEWKLKTPEQLLDLKVCDPAMGSGAFLVQACRFLSARLVEAWAIEEATGRVVDLTGQVHEPRTSVESMPPGVEARAENARRIVAERCLYGVDLNPLAVELAKLSLWLVTLSKGRPFGFLDHNLRCGDSLLGISRLDQLTELSLDPSATRQGRLFGKAIERAVGEAVELRRKLGEI